jgi:hypothetical protein
MVDPQLRQLNLGMKERKRAIASNLAVRALLPSKSKEKFNLFPSSPIL